MPLSGLAGNNPASCREKNTPTPELTTTNPDMIHKNLLLDAREFVEGKNTGIGRFLEGLVDSLAETFVSEKIVLLGPDEKAIPSTFRKRKNVVF